MSFFFQAEEGIRGAKESRGLGDVYKGQADDCRKMTSWSQQCYNQEQKDTDRTSMKPAKEKIEGVGGTQTVSLNMLIVV